jgi:RNA polymerase sigma factor (sigma-70 family)
MLDPGSRPADSPTPVATRASGAASSTSALPVRFAVARSEAEFTAFVARHRRLIGDYVSATLRGTPESEVDRESVVQDALVRVWRSWATWPRTEGRRRAFLKRTLRLTALDALRVSRGRDGRRVREQPADLGAVDRLGDGLPRGTEELGRALARSAVDATATVLERSVVVSTLDALTDLERRAVALSVQGFTDREVAARLELTHQRARTVLMDARALLRSLADHADRPVERTDWPLLGSATSKRQRRLVRRHLEHCAACRLHLDPAPRTSSSTTGVRRDG